jgi:DNA-binding XRE family transcriptional regulator
MTEYTTRRAAAAPLPRVDISGLGDRGVREAIRRRLAASTPAPRPFDRFWDCLARRRFAAIPRSLLVIADVARVARAFSGAGDEAWRECFGRCHPLLAAVVRGRADERQAGMVDAIARASGARLWVYPLRGARPHDVARLVDEMLGRLDPDVVIDVRWVEPERNIWIEFSDGLRRTIAWRALALDAVDPPLRPATVRVGRADPESVEFLDARGGVFDIDAASLRAMLDPDAARRQFAVAEAAAQSLGERLRARRLALGVTQEQLASRSGLTQEMISHLERGRHQPRFATLDRYARGLGLPVAGLLGS